MDNECDNHDSNQTKGLHVNIPLRLAKRVRLAAKENGTTITNIVIEALDEFLRKQEQ